MDAEQLYRQYKEQGLSDEEILELYKKEDSITRPRYTTTSNFKNDDSIVKQQLEIKDILNEVRRFLAGEVEVRDAEGNLSYERDEDLVILSPKGIHLFMNTITLYVSRMTLLSRYNDMQEIDIILFDLGMELKDVLFTKFKEMGLDSPEKRKIYSILVVSVCDFIRSAYYRALQGEERRTLREAIQITQNLNEDKLTPIQKKRGLFSFKFGGGSGA